MTASLTSAVCDGPALVEAVLTHRPDVSVVDVRMPPTHTGEGLRPAPEDRFATVAAFASARRSARAGA